MSNDKVSAQEQLKQLEKAIADAQFEAQYGIGNAAENVMRLQATAAKLKAEIAEEEKAQKRADSIGRFKKAAERANQAMMTTLRNGLEALTDDDSLLQNIVRGMAQNAVYQIVSTEGYYARVNLRAARSYGRENYYDGRIEDGESPDHGNSVVDQAERALNQLSELDTLAIALERYYDEIQDRRIKRGELGLEGAYPCFRAGNLIAQIEEQRQRENVRQVQRQLDWRKEQAAIQNGQISVDRLLSN